MLAEFDALATFGNSRFHGHADFSSVRCDRHFDLAGAKFAKLPKFSQVDFKQAPDLDDVSLPLLPFWTGGDKDLVPSYRAIKRLAIQAHDYEREQMAFKGELRARRWVVDRWFAASVWLGILYDGLSDCGRSFWRPFVLWIATLLAFAVLYLGEANPSVGHWLDVCASVQDTPKWVKALSLSVSNAVPVISAMRIEEVRAIYSCLYPPASLAQTVLPLFSTPRWIPILEVVQNVLSTILIFLFLLGIRNQFKIR